METKKGLSIAVMLSIIGLLGLSFGTVMGNLLLGKPMGIAIALGAAVLIVGALSLYLAVKAKTVDNEFAKWRKFEFVGVAACVAVVAFAVTPTIYSANFIFSNSELRQAGTNDVDAIRGMISTFRAQEADRLSLTGEGLDNYLTFMPTKVAPELSRFIAFDVMKGQGGTFNRYVLNDYIAEKSYLVEHGSLQEDLFGKYEHELTLMSDKLSAFDFTDFADLSTSLTALSDSVGANLTALSRSLNLGVVTADSNGRYGFRPSDSFVYSTRAQDFGNAYASMFAVKVSSVALALAFALLFISDYLLEFRSLRMPAAGGPKISDKDGIPL